MKPPPPSTAPAKLSAMDTFSPVGLHVLVVDDDLLCLLVLERMLKKCSYKDILRDSEDDVDLVLSDVYMPDVDGFKLLETIGLELDLPVIMMSVNGDTSVVMKGITHGACDYLIKPVRIEELKNLWQHVVRKKGTESPRSGLCSSGNESLYSHELLDNSSKKRKELSPMMGAELVEDAISQLKRTRVNWTVDLHQRFVKAVNQLGVEKAVPKKLLEVMNVKGLTRENVASHLQKYRLYLKRLSGVTPAPGPIASFQAAGGGKSGGTMRVLSRGKGLNSLPDIKGLSLGVGLIGPSMDAQNLVPGTRKSLTQFEASQQQRQRLSANTAQVLGACGFVDSHLQDMAASPACDRTAALDLHAYDLVPRSHLISSHSMPSVWGEYGFHPLKVEDEMGTWPHGVLVEGFVRRWNINSVGKSDIGHRVAAADTAQMHRNQVTSNMKHASSLGTHKCTNVEIPDNTSATNLLHDMSSSISTEVDKEASFDAIYLDGIPQQLNVFDNCLLDDECLFDNGGFSSD